MELPSDETWKIVYLPNFHRLVTPRVEIMRWKDLNRFVKHHHFMTLNFMNQKYLCLNFEPYPFHPNGTEKSFFSKSGLYSRFARNVFYIYRCWPDDFFNNTHWMPYSVREIARNGFRTILAFIMYIGYFWYEFSG